MLFGLTIQGMQQPVFAGQRHQLPGLAADRRSEKRADLRQIPIVRVAWRGLVMPLQFAGTSVEHDQRIGVEVGARTSVGQEIRGRIGHWNVNESGLWIERERRPDRASAALPDFRVAPGLGAWFAIGRDGVESPNRLARFELERADPASDSLLADSDSEQDQIL